MTPLQTLYRQLRTKYRLTALDAWRAAQHQIKQDVHWRLLGLPEVPRFIKDVTLDVNGYELNISCSLDNDYRQDSEDFKLHYKQRRQPKQRDDRYRIDSDTHVELKEWTEGDAYQARVKYQGKALARQLAIDVRKALVKEAGDYAYGNMAYYYIRAQCKALDFDEYSSSVREDDEDEIRSLMRDAVESVFRLSQSVKEPA